MKSFQAVLKCLFFVFFTFFSVQVFGQWERLKTPGLGSFVPTLKHKGVLYSGTYVSKDNGLTWKRKTIPRYIQSTWADGDTIYAEVQDTYYGEPIIGICLFKSIDHGNTWINVPRNYKKGYPNTEIFAYNKVTVAGGVTYLLGSGTGQGTRTGIFKRNCDTCNWEPIRGYTRNPDSNVDIYNIDGTFFALQEEWNEFPLKKLYRVDGDSLKVVFRTLNNYGGFLTVSDTLFFRTITKSSNIDSVYYSLDKGKNWSYISPKFNTKLSFGKRVKVNEFYYYNHGGGDVYRTKNLIEWDTISTKNTGMKQGAVNLVYGDGRFMIGQFSTDKTYYVTRDSGKTWKYEYFLSYRNNDLFEVNDSTIGSEQFYSNDDGINWKLNYKLGYEYRGMLNKKNSYYGIRTYGDTSYLNLFRDTFLINEPYQQEDGKSILNLDKVLGSSGNSFLFIRDTLFSVPYSSYSPNDFLLFSTDLGNTWRKIYTKGYTPNSEKKGYGSGFKKIGNWIYLYGANAFSKDMRNWKVLKEYSILGLSGAYSYNVTKTFGDTLYCYTSKNGGTKTSLFKINLNDESGTDLLTDRLFTNKEIYDFAIGREKIWVLVDKKYIYESNINNLSWRKIFEVPTKGDIQKIIFNGDFLFATIFDSYYRERGFNIPQYDTINTLTYRLNVTKQSSPNLYGKTFWDKNQNAKYDSTDTPFSEIIVKNRDTYTSTDNDGQYAFYVPSQNDTVRPILPKKFMTSIPNFYIINLKDTTRNFAIQSPEYQDLSIYINTPSVFRPGFETATTITVENRGLKAQNATAKLVLDKKTEFISAVPNATRVNDTLFWDLGLLAIDEVKNIQLKFKTPVTTPRDSFIRLTTNVLPVEQDSAKEDNADVLVSRVVGSYDPNDKLVEPKTLTPENVKIGVPLEYTIRFQNTGNYPASFVIVEDTLADYFDLASFRFISSSHKCSYEYKGKGIIRFIFNDINLPDSISNEAGSHGFASFTITPKNVLKKGDVIQNKAFIYFDYNLPIITPISKLTINTPTSIWSAPSVSEGNLKLSPNPAHDILTFDIDNANFTQGNLSIYDLSGRLMLAQNVFNRKEVVNIGSLGSGEYIVVIKSKYNLVFSNKFLKIN